MNNLSSSGMDNLPQAFHTCAPYRGGSGVTDDKYLRLFCVFHSIQNMGLASRGVVAFYLIARCASCMNPNVYAGSHVRGMHSFCAMASRSLLTVVTLPPVQGGAAIRVVMGVPEESGVPWWQL